MAGQCVEMRGGQIGTHGPAWGVMKPGQRGRLFGFWFGVRVA